MSILKSVRAGKYSKCTLFPKSKDELKAMIGAEIRKNGYNCSLNHIDTSEITDMSGLFIYSVFNGDISEWDVSRVRDMSYMFYDSQFNQDISNWNVKNVIDMSNMFGLANFNRDISKWDISNVYDMNRMFLNSYMTQDLSKWRINVQKTNILYMFKDTFIKEEHKPIFIF